jgi:predicted nucleic acid-binding protein
MIVAAESNFLLQLAFEQEEGGEARSIFDLAESGQIRLVIPACALFEPYETLVRRHKKRDRLLDEFQREINELARSSAFSGLANTSRSVADTIAGSATIEANALDDTIDRIARVATVIPLTGDIVTAAAGYRQRVYDFTPPDAIVFASIDRYLQSEDRRPKVFTTKDATGFMKPEIREHLGNYNCRVIPKFADTLGYVRDRLTRADAAPPRSD